MLSERLSLGNTIHLRDYLGTFSRVEGVVRRVTPLIVEITRLSERNPRPLKPTFTTEYSEGDGWIEEYPLALCELALEGTGREVTHVPPAFEGELAHEYMVRYLASLV